MFCVERFPFQVDSFLFQGRFKKFLVEKYSQYGWNDFHLILVIFKLEIYPFRVLCPFLGKNSFSGSLIPIYISYRISGGRIAYSGYFVFKIFIIKMIIRFKFSRSKFPFREPMSVMGIELYFLFFGLSHLDSRRPIAGHSTIYRRVKCLCHILTLFIFASNL